MVVSLCASLTNGTLRSTKLMLYSTLPHKLQLGWIIFYGENAVLSFVVVVVLFVFCFLMKYLQLNAVKEMQRWTSCCWTLSNFSWFAKLFVLCCYTCLMLVCVNVTMYCECTSQLWAAYCPWFWLHQLGVLLFWVVSKANTLSPATSRQRF